MKLIVGLGNPDKKYAKTRHNIGWMVLDELLEQLKKYDDSLKWNESKKGKVLYLKTNLDNQKIELYKPLTYMNESGYSVSYAVKKHEMDIANDLIVIHDDKDIELGKVKVQNDRSSAGHNGVKSIIQNLKTQNFIRIRVGIANNRTSKTDTANFVLKKFGFLERKKLQQAITVATEEIYSLLKK